jgi:nitrite reductase/ring-hydroxylating ferredoxin subunit
MSEHPSSPAGPDFTQGVALADVPEGGMVTGHIGGNPALLVRRAGDLLIRCPWHHACFSLRTGQVVRPPALSDLKCRRVEQRGGRAFVRDALPAAHYVGHAEHWDRADVDGDPAARDCMVTYWRNDKRLAVATVGRDLASLRAEAAFEEETPA